MLYLFREVKESYLAQTQWLHSVLRLSMIGIALLLKTYIGTMPAHHLRCWASIEPTEHTYRTQCWLNRYTI